MSDKNKKIIERGLPKKSSNVNHRPVYEKRDVFEDSVEYSTMPKYDRPGRPGNK